MCIMYTLVRGFMHMTPVCMSWNMSLSCDRMMTFSRRSRLHRAIDAMMSSASNPSFSERKIQIEIISCCIVDAAVVGMGGIKSTYTHTSKRLQYWGGILQLVYKLFRCTSSIAFILWYSRKRISRIHIDNRTNSRVAGQWVRDQLDNFIPGKMSLRNVFLLLSKAATRYFGLISRISLAKLYARPIKAPQGSGSVDTEGKLWT